MPFICSLTDFYYCYIFGCMEDTKLSFTFTPDDVKILNSLKAKLSVTMGKVSNIAAIRVAMILAMRSK